MTEATLPVNEIFLSLQGESTLAGLPCVFVRLARCNLRCSYCDTAYAFGEGTARTLADILDEVQRLAARWSVMAGPQRLPLVEVTGGEPLLHPNTLVLLERLCAADYTVLLETNGALDISAVDSRVRRIMDLKCPSSGECHRNRLENLSLLRSTDEVKFVISSHEDFVWAREQIISHRLAARCPLLFSWAAPLLSEQQDSSLKTFPVNHTRLTRQELAERILADQLPVRFQAQLHKIIWPADQRGV